MSHTLLTLFIILALVLCPDHARAQQDTTDAVALREKAFKLLESAAGQLNSLQSPENRARLGANIADSLWNHDEKRARVLFALVEEDIRAGMANRDLKDPKDALTLKVFLKLRVETVERIAKYDGELALAFLKATEFISDERLPHDMTELERGLEIRMAKRAASASPDVALKLARQSLAQGVSDDLLQVLRQLNRKHKEHAMILYKEVVKKLRELNLTKDWSTARFAESLVQNFKPPTSNDPTFRELISLLVTRALEHGCTTTASLQDNDAEFCRLVASVLPQMEKLDPRAAQLQRWSRHVDDVTILPETLQEFFEAYDNGSIDDLLALAARHPDFRDDILRFAANKAMDAGDFAQARRIAKDRMVDPEKKQDLVNTIAQRETWNRADEKELAEMQSRLDHVPSVAHRIRILLSFSAQYGAKNRTTALKLLKQGTDMADTMKPGNEQTEAQLTLAVHYCFLKSDRGFAIMESMLPKLNELVNAAMKLDGYETSYVSQGEWNMSANGPVGVILTGLSNNAGSFAWCDFDRAVSLAAQFERSEIRLMAQVKLAQAVLAGPPTGLRDRYGYIY
ncbi:MAG TPA: hypothetical protein VJM50_19850 [Pyrinomonadaceae bacterium]|nr:hypothetical protein [Pyrinomonadaceae bacterium]